MNTNQNAVAKNNVIVTIPIDKLKLDFFVRTALNEDRVMQMALLYESNGINALPALKVTKDFSVIDGRHRYEGLKLSEKTEAMVEIIVEDDPIKLLKMATEANLGGSLPPASVDIEFAVKQMLDKGEKPSEIVNWLAPTIGIAAARKRVSWAATHLKQTNITKALRAMGERGLTAIQAATEFGLDIGDVQDAIIGKTKKMSKGNKARNDFSNKTKAINMTLGQTIRSLMGDLVAGNIDSLEVRKFIDDVKEQGEHFTNKAKEYYTRLEKAI